jgi:manganese efflux pump family protein
VDYTGSGFACHLSPPIKYNPSVSLREDNVSPVEILLVAVGLAMDSFAVSLGVGTSGQARTARPILRLSFHLGLFQGLMTLLGWLAGVTIARFITSIDHWVALVLLIYVGGSMIRSGLSQESHIQTGNPTKGKTLVMLSVATSIDALAVGLSLGMVEVNIVGASLVIAFVTLGFSLAGLLAGRQLGIKFGKRMEVVGGIILIGIGLNILVTHLFK